MKGDRFRRLFDEMGDAGFVVDTEFNTILEANKAAAYQTGYTKEELIGMNIVDDLSAGDPLMGNSGAEKFTAEIALLHDRLSREERVRFIQRKRKKDGTLYWEEVIVVPLHSQGQRIHISVNRDISERISSEETLRESEERHRVLFEQLSDALFVEELDGRILDVNESSCRLLGYTREELTRMTVPDLLPSGAPGFLPEEIDAKTRKAKNIETVNICKDGTLVPVELRGRIVSIGGQPRLLASLRDISKRVKAEKIRSVMHRIADAVNTTDELSELFSEIRHLLGDVLDTTNFRIALYDRESDTISMPYMVDENDPPFPFVAGRSLTAHVIWTNRPLLLTEEERETFFQREGYTPVHTVSSPSKVWLGVPLRLENEVIGAVVVQSYTDPALYTEDEAKILELVSTQISAAIRRKQAEDELREREEQYRSIFESTTDAMLIYDLAGKIVAANKSACGMYGYGEGELIGLSAEKIVHPDYFHGFKNFKHRARKGNRFKANSVNMRKDGTSFIVEVHGSGFTYRGDPHLLAVVRDISERVRAEEEIRSAKEDWERTFDAVPDYIAILDKDFRIRRINEPMAEKLGITPQQAMGMLCYECVHGTKQPPSFCPQSKLLEDGREHSVEICEGRLGGELMLTVSPIRDAGGKLVGSVHVARDINARVRTERALRDSSRKIERLHEIARLLGACKEEDEAYRATMEAAERILNFSLASLDIVDGEKLVVKETSIELPPDASRESSLDGGGLAAKTYRTGETILFGSMDEVPEATPTREDFCSGISAPIGDIGVFQVVSTEVGAFTEEDTRLLDLLLGHTAEAIERIRLQNELREQAIHDPLTGAYNRRYFNQVIEREIGRSKRYDRPIGFLMIDVDRFKEINDRFGHQIGDEVLRTVANLLKEQVRETDVVVRYGGDEFLILLIETDGETMIVKERILAAMEERNRINAMIDFPVTLSIGRAHWTTGCKQTVEETLAEADRRMYEEKSSLTHKKDGG